MRRTRNKTYVKLPGEARKARLTVDAWEDMKGELLWPLYDDVLSCGVPANHVVVLWSLEKAGGGRCECAKEKRDASGDVRVELGEEGGLGLCGLLLGRAVCF